MRIIDSCGECRTWSPERNECRVLKRTTSGIMTMPEDCPLPRYYYKLWETIKEIDGILQDKPSRIAIELYQNNPPFNAIAKYLKHLFDSKMEEAYKAGMDTAHNEYYTPYEEWRRQNA